MSNRHRASRWNYLTLLLWSIALVLVGWTLTQLPLNDIAAQLELLSWQDWLLWSLVNIAIVYLAVKRWQILGLALQTPMPLSHLFRLRQAGSTVSFLTPGPQFGGEPLQLYWLSRHFGKPLHSAIALLGVDRFMETGVNIAVLLAGVLILLGTAILPVAEILQISATLAGVLLLMLIAAGLVVKHPDWLANRFRPLAQRWQAAVENRHEMASDNEPGGWPLLVNLLKGALDVNQSRLWLALLVSMVGWVALLVELTLLLGFLGLSVTPSDVVLIMVGMRLAMLLPMPGGIGTIEASLLWSFSFLGLPVSAAIGLIALIRLRDVLILLVGLGCLWSFHQPRVHNKPTSTE